MPQIWMTYAEIAGLLDCAPDEARERAIQERLDRKHSRDGNTRVKLSYAWIGLFIDRVRSVDAINGAIGELRQIHKQMGSSDDHHGHDRMEVTALAVQEPQVA